MYRELDAQGEKPAEEEPAPDEVCQCTCGEPAMVDGSDAPLGNRTAVNLEQHWEYNG